MAEATINFRSSSGSSYGRRTPSRHVTMTPPPMGKPQSPLANQRTITTPEEAPQSRKSAQRRWKHHHEEVLMSKLVEKRLDKKDFSQSTKEKARKIARKVPTDVLAKEWLVDNKATVETRAFLVDKVLPTLILGIEKLLMEANMKGLTEKNEQDPNFNPVNFLAQYLMRNNPKYSNFSEASPYIRGLREVHEELRKQLFDYEENRLARIKAEAKAKREHREQEEKFKVIEKKRREDCLKKQFIEWNVGYDGRIELTLLQNALRSFVEITQQYPEELKKASQLSHEIEPTDETGKTLSLKEFAQYLQKFITDMPSEIFDQFLQHLYRCSLTFRAATQREQRRVTLTNLFVACDHSGIGLLDRHRILSLFEKYYDQCKEEYKNRLRNPRRWPVVEVDEGDSDFSDEESFDGGQSPTLINENQNVTKQFQPGSRKGSAASVKATEDQKGDTDEKVFQTESEPGDIPADRDVSVVDSAVTEDQKDKTVANDGDKKQVTDQPTEDEKQDAEKPDDDSDKPSTKDMIIAEDQVITPPPEPVLAGDTVPADGNIQPSTDDQPSSDVAPITTDQPPADVPPSTSDQPTTDVVPSAGDQPSDDVAPTTEDQPAADVVPTTDEIADVPEPKPLMAEDGNEVPSDDIQTANGNQPKTDETPATDSEKPADVTAPDATEQTTTEKDNSSADHADKPADDGSDSTVPAVIVEQAPAPHAKQVVADTAVISEKEQQAEKVQEKDKDETVTEDKGLITAEKADKDMPLPKTPMTAGDMPPPTRGASVTFGEGTVFERERSMLVTRGSGSQSQMSAFDESAINVSQFVHVTETFLGEMPLQDVFQNLVKFIRDGYVETEEEKMQRLLKAHREAQSAKRKFRVDHLFEKWDNDGSGYIDLDEIETIMSKYKDGQEKQALQKARKALKQKDPNYDNRLSKREFRDFVQHIIEEIPGADTFEFFVEFLENSVERTYAERIRGEARKKWLQQIVKAAETGGASMEPVYRAVFQALYKDAETHGGGKVISANIAMLENNEMKPERGPTVLRYVASTPDDADCVLGKLLYKDMRGISHAACQAGKPIHVPRVSNHGNIMFWNQDKSYEEREGSFMVVPLKDRRKCVFGTLGIDTLRDPHTKAIFITHEIEFFQGVAKAFSIAYHHVDTKRKTLTITESAISWIHRRSPHVAEITVYIVEPDGKEEDYILRKMMSTDHKGEPQNFASPARLERKDNLFRDYLFRCVDNSESITADAYGQRHFSFPLRDNNGMAVAVIDINNAHTKTLPKYEKKEILHMLKLLQTAQKEITKESASGEKTAVLEAEKQHEQSRVEIMFDRLMLIDLRQNVNKLNAQAYAEIKSYKDPPKFVINILKATLSLFYLDKAEEGEFDDWNNSKLYLNSDLNQKITAYDPTKDGANVPYEKISKPLDDVPHGDVAKHSSQPAEYLYNWVFACFSLIQHTQRMKKNSTHAAQG